MHASRREFLYFMGSAAAAGLLPTLASARGQNQSLHFVNKPLRGGSFVIGDLPTGGNVWIMPSQDGPIMVDSKFAYTAPELAADVQSLLHSRPALLINTHHHADHTGGNWMFSDHARIVAHANMNPRIERNMAQYVQQTEARAATLEQEGADDDRVTAAREMADRVKQLKPEQFRARQTINENRTELEHSGVTLHIHHFGNGHTDNDIVIYLPEQNIIHMGDLVFNGTHPFIDRSAKANTRSWQNVLRQVMELCDDATIVIPGHGEVANRDALTRQINYFDQLREIVTAAIDQGKTREEVTALRPEQFKDYGLEFIRPIALGGMYDEIQESR